MAISKAIELESLTHDRVWDLNGKHIKWPDKAINSAIVDPKGQNGVAFAFHIDKELPIIKCATRFQTKGSTHLSTCWNVEPDGTANAIIQTAFPKNAKSCDVELLVGKGEYQRALTLWQFNTTNVQRHQYGQCRIESISRHNQTYFYTLIPKEMATKFCQLRVFNKSGKNIASSHARSVDFDDKMMAVANEIVRKEDIDRVEVWTMDTEKFLFRNVPIVQPDKVASK